MVWVRGATAEQGLADKERRDTVAETDLDGVGGAFLAHPVAQCLTLGGVDRYREQLMGAGVRARYRAPLFDEAVDHISHSLRQRAFGNAFGASAGTSREEVDGLFAALPGHERG